MPYDYSKLSGRIVEKYETQAKFACAMGLSERSISLKINGKVGWKQNEILKACELLDIPVSQIYIYFLLQKFKIEQLDKRECKEAGGDTLKFLGVEEVKKLLQIKDSKAYEVIRQLNTELAQKGYLTRGI